MGSLGESQLSSLKRWVNNLRQYKGYSNFVENALNTDKSKINEIRAVRNKLESKGKLPGYEVKEVFLDRIYTEQPYLEKDKLLNYIDKDIHELAEGYMHQGDVLVIDGNHRLTLAKLNNQSKVRMKIINLDRPKK